MVKKKGEKWGLKKSGTNFVKKCGCTKKMWVKKVGAKNMGKVRNGGL